MSYKIFTPGEVLEVDKVKIKKPYEVGSCYTLDIVYGDDNLQIFFQTPESLLPFGFQEVDDGFIIDIALNDDNFIELLTCITKKIHKRLEKNLPELLKGRRFINPLKNRTLRFKTQSLDEILIFDHKNKRLEGGDIKKGDKMIMIFHFENIVIFKDFCKLNFKLVQCKKVNIVFKECLFSGGEMIEKTIKPPPIKLANQQINEQTQPVAATRAMPSLAEITGALKKLKPTSTKEIS